MNGLINFAIEQRSLVCVLLACVPGGGRAAGMTRRFLPENLPISVDRAVQGV